MGPHRFEHVAEGVRLWDGIVVEDPDVGKIGKLTEGNFFAALEAAAAPEVRVSVVVTVRNRAFLDMIAGSHVTGIIHNDDALQRLAAPL